MEIERIARSDGRCDIWAYDWDLTKRPPVKCNRFYLGIEQPVPPSSNTVRTTEAISWAYGRTLGNIATSNPDVIKSLPAANGVNDILECEIVSAGLYRNGKDRFWCRTHQKHWGTKADIQDAAREGTIRCAQWSQPMSFVTSPYELRPDNHAEVGVWCSLPPAITSQGTPRSRYPRIHVHVRNNINGHKIIDQDFEALTIITDPGAMLFNSHSIDKIHITPPAANDFILALEFDLKVTCFNCTYCGSPHLDLGIFNQTPHRKHLCGNCGRDSTWTKTPSSSTPLKPLHQIYDQGYGFIDSNKHLNIDEWPDCEFALWASTPAILWKANRPQERGIHVHLSVNGQRVIDETFGTVIYQGEPLTRSCMLEKMMDSTLKI